MVHSKMKRGHYSIYSFAVRAAGIGISAAALLTSATAWAGEDSNSIESIGAPAWEEQPFSKNTMTGDWGGVRNTLFDKGVDIKSHYWMNLTTNVSGGEKKTTTEAGEFAVIGIMDLEKIWGQKGGRFVGAITYRNGPSLSQKARMDNLMSVQEVIGFGQTWRLVRFELLQSFGKKQQWDIKIGRMGESQDFATMPCNFMNLGFCISQIAISTEYFNNWPVSVWGSRLRYRKPSFYVMGGVHLVNPKNTKHGLQFGRFKGTKGVNLPFEAGWTPRLGKKGMPGSYRVGGWYSTTQGDDLFYARDGKPLAMSSEPAKRHHKRYGGYLQIEQQLSGTAVFKDGFSPTVTKGASYFLYLTVKNKRVHRIDSLLATGFYYKGMSNLRPNDNIGIGVSRVHYSKWAARNDVLLVPTSRKRRSETVLEGFYSYQVAPWIFMRPSVQVVLDPGGYKRKTDDVVLGLKSVAAF